MWFLRISGGAIALVGLARYPFSADESYWFRLLWGGLFLLGIHFWTRPYR